MLRNPGCPCPPLQCAQPGQPAGSGLRRSMSTPAFLPSTPASVASVISCPDPRRLLRSAPRSHCAARAEHWPHGGQRSFQRPNIHLMLWLLLFLRTAWPERPARALASSEFALRPPIPPGPRGLLLTFLSAHVTSPGTVSTASRPHWVLAPRCMLWQQREPLLQSHYPMR